jgi:hypothetical protein
VALLVLVVEPSSQYTIISKHISILQARFHFAAHRREKLLEKNPELSLSELVAIDDDIVIKKWDLENAINEEQKHRRNNNTSSYHTDRQQ